MSANYLSNKQVQKALSNLIESAIVLYTNFQVWFKLLALLFLAYLAFKLGKLTVSEPIIKKIKRVQKQIQKYNQEKQSLPNKIKKISSRCNKIVIVFLILLKVLICLLFLQQISIPYIYLSPFIVIPILIYIFKTIYLAILRAKSGKISNTHKQIKNQVASINKDLGPKVQSFLKAFLCKDRISQAQANSSSHVCTKTDCRQMREAIKKKYEYIKVFAQSALTFEWCYICKGRKPINELLKFQPKPMPVPDGTISEDQDAEVKISYLLETLQQIEKWVLQAGPCNCSKLYMEEIMKNRKQYIQQSKKIHSVIQVLQTKREYLNSKLNEKSQKHPHENSYNNVYHNITISPKKKI